MTKVKMNVAEQDAQNAPSGELEILEATLVIYSPPPGTSANKCHPVVNGKISAAGSSYGVTPTDKLTHVRAMVVSASAPAPSHDEVQTSGTPGLTYGGVMWQFPNGIPVTLGTGNNPRRLYVEGKYSTSGWKSQCCEFYGCG
jgi:hypothetical protein